MHFWEKENFSLILNVDAFLFALLGLNGHYIDDLHGRDENSANIKSCFWLAAGIRRRNKVRI